MGLGAPDDGAPKNIDALIQSVGAREHQVFAGRLDPSHLKGRDRLQGYNVTSVIRY